MPDIYKISIALTGEQVGILKSAVDAGEYATTSEIVREAIRDWRRKRQRHLEDARRRRNKSNAGGRAKPSGSRKSRRTARTRRTTAKRKRRGK